MFSFISIYWTIWVPVFLAPFVLLRLAQQAAENTAVVVPVLVDSEE
jgi:hypothetical protein